MSKRELFEKILKEHLKVETFSKSIESQYSIRSKNKIYDFQIYLVEIDENQNPDFDPIDLFIRLNDKPYPIRENSFEMWNYWADVDVIETIKKLKESVDQWFFIKQIKRSNDRDIMENEELITSL